MISPAVGNPLRKAHKAVDFKQPVFEGQGTGKFSENLMLLGSDDQSIDVVIAVKNRFEIKVDAPVPRQNLPGFQVVVAAPAVAGNFKPDIVKLVMLPVIKNHVLARGGGVPESVTELESDSHAFQDGRKRGPVPGVFIGPHAPAPIEDAEG